MRLLAKISLVLLPVLAVNGQPASDLKFEVASLKPVSIEDGKPISMIGFDGGPGTGDPGRLVSYYTTLRMILVQAYGVRTFQVVGPAWLDTERYDIVAKVPPGATKEQARIMLQNLLVERFKLVAHRDKKDLPVYALTVGKEELKMKTAAPPSPPEDAPPSNGPRIGADGFPILSARLLEGGPIILFRRGQARLQARKATMLQLTEALTSQLDRLLIDETNLKGEFDIELNWTPESIGTVRGPAPAPPTESGGQAIAADPASPLWSAIREQLGLRVIAKKAPVDVVVVDHMEKVASEN